MSSTMLLPTTALLQRVITTTIRGAFIADAASMGTHWIYNPVDMLATVDSKTAPEFKDPPAPKFYDSTEFPNHYLSGMLSPYGEQLLFVTKYVASKEEITGASMSTAMYEWATTFGGRPDHATLTFMENIKSEDTEKKYPHCGADDDQAHIYMKIVPVTTRYVDTSSGNSGRSNQLLIQKVAEIIRVHQNNDIAVAFGIVSARILEAVILSSSTSPSTSSTPSTLLHILDTCYDTVRTDLEAILGSDKSNIIDMVLESYQRGKSAATEFATLDELLLKLSNEKMKDQPDSPFYNLAGRSCALPGSFIGPMYQLYKLALSQTSTSVIDEQSYIDAIRENILAAGDTCSRGVFVGAVVGAAMVQQRPSSEMTTSGSDANIFESLWNKVEINTRNEIQSYADKIAQQQTKQNGATKDEF